MAFDQSLLRTMEWRCIGPPRGGRVVAVTGDPADPMTFYFGACAGGVWKSDDGGAYWQNVSDGYFKTSAVGAIAVAESDPNVVYAGMGESCIRSDVSHGDGVYRSSDAGRSWSNIGLQNTRHISRVRVHPTNPDLVYVAALGHAWGPNPERGIFRSPDGGQSWEHVLYKDDTTGAADLSLDPNNPRIMFAALWQVQRYPWALSSGGPGSGIHRSTDGGQTWEDITRHPGLPEGIMGRIGIAVSPAKPGRIWATVESEDAGLFRSDDYGDTWSLVSDNRDLQGRPWYYQHVFADTKDPDSLWILNYKTWKSIDGGANFFEVTTPHDDNHDLWIDPKNPLRMIEGNDGGACVSFNGGETWSSIYNQMTAQFYHVTADNRTPYRIYGTQQDNTSVSVPSRNRKGAITWEECRVVGSGESGHIAVHPDNPNVVFAGAIGSSPGGGGNLLRYDYAADQTRIVTVWPELYTGLGAKEMKYRFQWTYPISFSPHNPDTLYVAGNRLFASRDQGQSWQILSPDLTRDDPSTQEPSGGPITKDTSGAEVYGTIFAFVESPVEPGLFWAGSDDGLIHVSRDGGTSWANVTPEGLPDWALVCNMEPSHHDPATAYICATRYRLDDTRPYLFRTADYGQTWTPIVDGIPVDDFTRVLKEDPERPGLLYAGTETSIYFSADNGDYWHPLSANLPSVPIYDLTVQGNEIAVASHGRGFWILDDLHLLRQLAEFESSGGAHLFATKDTLRMPGPKETSGKATAGANTSVGKKYRIALETPATYYETPRPGRKPRRAFLNAGQNPEEGVAFDYFLESPAQSASLQILDSQGRVAVSCASDSEDTPLPTAQGINRFVWDMHYPPAIKLPGDKTTEDDVASGPLAPPGLYKVRLDVDGVVREEQFRIVKDPNSAVPDDDLVAQFDLLMQVHAKVSETHLGLIRLRSISEQVTRWRERALGMGAEEAVSTADEILETLGDVEEQLVQTRFKGARDRLHYPVRLNKKLSELTKVVGAGDYPPTDQARAVFLDISARIDQQLVRLEETILTGVAKFNDQVGSLGLIPVDVSPIQP